LVSTKAVSKTWNEPMTPVTRTNSRDPDESAAGQLVVQQHGQSESEHGLDRDVQQHVVGGDQQRVPEGVVLEDVRVVAESDPLERREQVPLGQAQDDDQDDRDHQEQHHAD
jgi:hypothetical protein